MKRQNFNLILINNFKRVVLPMTCLNNLTPISLFYSTTPNFSDSRSGINSSFESIIKIDRGVWKTYIFPFNLFVEGLNNLYANMKPERNYALFIQGSYKNNFISIGPKVLINTETSKEFLSTYFEYYLDLLSSKNYDVKSIKDIIFRVKDTEFVKIVQPSLPKNEEAFVQPTYFYLKNISLHQSLMIISVN